MILQLTTRLGNQDKPVFINLANVTHFQPHVDDRGTFVFLVGNPASIWVVEPMNQILACIPEGT
jgi:hypothetical protein